MNAFKVLIIFASMTASIPSVIFAHSGGTNDLGAHHCWTDCEAVGLQYGEYHYHGADDEAVSTFEENEDIYNRDLAESLHGRILLKVEDHGEAFYIRSSDSMAYYMANGDIAYDMMRFFSLGITDADLDTVPKVESTDEMNASTSACNENETANRLAGEILLQVESVGEAYYVDPVKCRAIYMADGAAAYEIMRFLGLGITNEDLAKIPVSEDVS